MARLALHVATVAVVAAVTFAASCRGPGARWIFSGWNFDATVITGGGYDNLDEARVHEILDRDSELGAWSGAVLCADAVGDV